MGSILLLLLACSSGAKPDPDSAAHTTTSHSTGDTATTTTETPTTESTPTDSTAGPDTVDDDGDGYSEAEGDCDDQSAGTHPGAYEEHCEHRDTNCDGFADRYCVKVNEHRYQVWAFDADGAVWHESGARWRTDGGDLACTSLVNYVIDSGSAACPDCEYSWREESRSWTAHGVGCWDIYWQMLGSDMQYVYDTPHGDDAGYVLNWSGPSGFSADSVYNFTGWVEYNTTDARWEAETYYGRWDPGWWYQYYVGTLRWVGYESTYWSDYTYTYVGPGFPIP